MKPTPIIKTNASPFLATKLIPPRRNRGVLPRPRLEHLIDQVAQATVTILKAPPGFGKSTLASTWAQAALARGARVAWLTLDDADNTCERLLLYVTAAVQRGYDGDRTAAPIKDLALLSADHLSILLLNDFERRSDECFLFIDDYHCVAPETLATAFEQLIRFAPANLHLVFSGRSDMPTSLWTHLYSDACLIVGANELRFDLDETRHLVMRTGLQEMGASAVLSLHQSTDGWIAALRAGLLSVRQRPGSSLHLPKSISGLFDELLSCLPAALSEQLPRLAAVDKFNAELAGRLVGIANGNGLIDQLERMQLFLSEHDETGGWFSFHPLFREHLRRRLPASELQMSLRATAQWFAAQHSWTDAVRTALAASDNDSAQQWIAHCAMDLVEQGDFIILLDWQRQLQHRLLQSPPQLKLAMAWAAGLAMTHSNSLQLLSEIETELGALNRLDERDDLYWECQALHAMLLAIDDKGEAGGELASRCLPHLQHRPWFSNTLLNVVSYGHLTASHWEDFYHVAPSIFEPLEHNGYLFTHIYRCCLTGLVELRQGRLTQAASALEQALSSTKAVGAPSHVHPVLRALPASVLAAVYYLQGRLKEAAQMSLENLALAKIGGFLDCVAAVFVTASRLDGMTVSHQRARTVLEEGERLAQTRQWPRLRGQMLLERVRISLLENKSLEAIACTHQLDQLENSQRLNASAPALEFQTFISLAELWCEAAGLSRRAEVTRAEELRQLAADNNQQLTHILLSASLAMVYWRRQEIVAAADRLLEACDRVDLSGANRLLLDLPAIGSLQKLTAHILADPITSLRHRHILQLLLPMASTDTQSSQPSLIAISLTSKERGVLELVAQGKSNKEMAKLLGITPETIKSHMKNIFSKLRVDSRAQAAVAAKASGLI